MKLVKSVHINLEAQAEQYEKLLAFAHKKAEVLNLPTGKQKADQLQNLVKQEVQVVSLIQELEKERVKLTEGQELKKIVENAGELQEPLSDLKTKIKQIVESLREQNDKNLLSLKVSQKIVTKMLQTVKDLCSTKGMTYSRVKNNKVAQTYRSVNYKV